MYYKAHDILLHVATAWNNFAYDFRYVSRMKNRGREICDLQQNIEYNFRNNFLHIAMLDEQKEKKFVSEFELLSMMKALATKLE